MSWSIDHLSASDCERIARASFDVKEKHGDELTGLCPFHGETGTKSLSFGYNIAKDGYKCFACSASGDLISLWAHAHGIDDNKEAFKRFTSEHGDAKESAPRRPARGPSPGESRGGAARNGGRGDAEATIYLPESDLSALPPLPENWVKRAASLWTWSPKTVTRLDLRLWTKGKEQRIAIPIRINDGRLVNIRLYNPVAEKGKKIRSWKKDCGKNKLFPAPATWPTEGILILCEGEKDCITALSHGFAAVTQTCGVTSWEDKFTPYFKGRDVVICYDADDAGAKGAAKVAKKLTGTASRVRVLAWPSIMADKQDLTDWFSIHRRTAQDLKDLIALAPEIAIEEPTAVKRGIPVKASYLRFFVENSRGGMSFRPRLLVDEVLGEKPLIHDPATGKHMAWNGRHWEEHSEAHIRNRVLTLLGEEGNSNRAADCQRMIRDLSLLPNGRQFNDRDTMLPLSNGMFSTGTFTIAPHDPEHLNTYTLGIHLDIDADQLPTCPRFTQFMAELIPDLPTRREVLKYGGLCLTRDVRYEKALILIGPGGDGKSTFIKLLEHIVGEHNVSNLTIGALHDQFQRVTLKDKLLNVATETEAGLLQSNMFKAVVSADRITAAFKFKDAFSFRPVAKHIYAANREPTVQDTTEGYFRRLIYVYVKKSFSTPDLDLLRTLKGETDAIFLTLLRHYQLLQQEGFIETPYMKECLETYKEHLNPVIRFANLHLERTTTVNTETVTVYEKYRQFCARHGHNKPKCEAEFGKELKSHWKDLVKKRDSARSDSRRTYYVGVKIIDDSPGNDLEKVEYVP